MDREFDNIFMENAQFVAAKGYNHTEKNIADNIVLATDKGDSGIVYSIMLKKSLFLDDSLMSDLSIAVQQCLKSLFKKIKFSKRDLVLVVGVGNDGMTADALGPQTSENLEITEHLHINNVPLRGRGRIACIKSSVSGVTGLQSYNIIKGVVNEVKPSLIIAIDTLSSKRVERLAKVVQITDKGIVPGSGVGNAKTSLDESTLGVPVIAIGVPMVIYAKNIVADFLEQSDLSSVNINVNPNLSSMVVTVKDIDNAVKDFASSLGKGINLAVHDR